jgi:hypothetical protein
MFEALDIAFAKCNIQIPHRSDENIPQGEIQLQYLEKLRILDSK